MLTYLTTRWFDSSDFQYNLVSTLRSGLREFNPYDLPPSGRYRVYKQHGHLVLIAQGTKPHDYDNTFWYVRKSILKAPKVKTRS